MSDKCRYYISSPGHGIKCQGLIEGTSIKNVFGGPTDEAMKKKALHYETFCCNPNNCVKCPAFRAIRRSESAE